MSIMNEVGYADRMELMSDVLNMVAVSSIRDKSQEFPFYELLTKAQ